LLYWGRRRRTVPPIERINEKRKTQHKQRENIKIRDKPRDK